MFSSIFIIIDNWFYFLANANFGVPVNHCFYCGLLQCQNAMFLNPYKFQKIETVWFSNGFEIFQPHMKNDSKKHWNSEPKTQCLPLFLQAVHRDGIASQRREILINRNQHWTPWFPFIFQKWKHAKWKSAPKLYKMLLFSSRESRINVRLENT